MKKIIIRKNEKKKKFGADPEMGYCPLSIIRLGVQARKWHWGAWRWAAGALAGGRRAGLGGRAGRRRAAGAPGARQGHARPGRAAGPAGCALGALCLF